MASRVQQVDCDVDSTTDKGSNDLVILVVEGQSLCVSKATLSSASDVFAVMFNTNNFREGSSAEVELPGKVYADFVEFIQCLTSGALSGVTEKNVLRILPLADEYQTASLKERCETVAIKNLLEASNATLIYQYLREACRYRLDKLEERCIKLATKKTPEERTNAELETGIRQDETCKVQCDIIDKLSQTDLKTTIISGLSDGDKMYVLQSKIFLL